MLPFVVGKEYARQQLLDFVGSKQMQTGVIWGAKEPGCIIVTSGGRHGKKAGYFDQPIESGGWWYFGQGQHGDHSEKNSANSKLINGSKTILLFTTREPTASEVKARNSYGKLFRYQGMYDVLNCEIVIPDSGARKGNKLFRFHLTPCDESTGHGVTSTTVDLRAMRLKLSDGDKKSGSGFRSLVEFRHRSDAVRQYAMLRANGICEACGEKAPFVDDNGKGFLEVHHICRLADSGPDSVENVIAVCPNCHSRAHHAIDRSCFQAHLLEQVKKIEEKLIDN